MVTGGWDIAYQSLASTEVYRPSAGEWLEVPSALPRPLDGVSVVTLNNRLFLFGEKWIDFNWLEINFWCLCLLGGIDFNDNEYADILEYTEQEGEDAKWINVGEMPTTRGYQAVSIVDFENFKNHCRS